MKNQRFPEIPSENQWKIKEIPKIWILWLFYDFFMIFLWFIYDFKEIPWNS